MLFGEWKTRAAEDAPAIVTERTKPVSAERVLLLQTGKVVKGVVQQTATGYTVNVAGGKLVLLSDQVRFNADNMEDAYHLQSSSLPERPVSAHIDLARWCHTNGLPDQACKELREVLRIEPDSKVARTMLERINDQLLATKELPSVAARSDGQVSLLGNPTLGIPTDTLGGLPRQAALDFVSKVQPLLVNRCATVGCHGIGSGNSFELQRTRLGRTPVKSHSEQNLAAILERIDREQPHNSPLLAKLKGESKPNGIRSSHGGLSREQAQTLRNWIEAISEKPEPVVPVKIESETQDDVAKTEPPKPRSNFGNSDEGDDNLYRRLVRELRSGESN
jgi:hypothetical protein